jgi:hypothetical protein
VNSPLLSFQQVRLLLQFGANKAAVDDAACLPAPTQDDALPLTALLSSNSRVYPCDHWLSSEADSSLGCGVAAAAASSQLEKPEEDAKQQVPPPALLAVAPTPPCRSCSCLRAS